MTKLEEHLEGIINIFHQYSVRTGHFDTLTKCELKKLITTELANTIQNTKDRSAVDQIFRDLDEDRDGQVDFNEFLSLLASMLLTTHDNLHKE